MRKSLPPFIGEGMVTRRVVVNARDVVFLKGIVEASDGLAQVFAERGGDLTLAAPVSREEELDQLIAMFSKELGAIVERIDLESKHGDGVRVVSDAGELRRLCDEARRRGESVGLVTTMGALHDGHVALVMEARKHAAFVVVSIFVNPTQFGPNEDFSKYPRDIASDVKKLAGAGVNVVFTPDVETLYPPGEQTRVHVGSLADSLCGASRPGHFEGVATVVTKFFNLVGPCTTVFGKKDYQQFTIVRRFARDLLMPVTVIGHPIVRESDGLAMSSRNRYLSASERERALGLSRALKNAVNEFGRGERRVGVLRGTVESEVRRVADLIDYVEIADADSLEPMAADASSGERALVAIACRIGSTRLIDNVVLGEDA